MVSISGDGAPDGAPGRLTRESTFRLSAERTHRRDGYSVVRPAATGTGVTEIRGRKPTALAVGGIRQFIPQTTSGDILPVVNDGASPARGIPACRRVGFRTLSEVGGTGFVPRSGASCGAVTGAPIRKRVIDARFLRGLSPKRSCSRHGRFGHTSRPVGRVPVLTNDANPAVGCRTDPWEPTPRNIRDAGFSASRTPAQVPRVDVTLANVYETACTKRLGFDKQSSAVAQYHVGFTPVVNGGILSLHQDSHPTPLRQPQYL